MNIKIGDNMLYLDVGDKHQDANRLHRVQTSEPNCVSLTLTFLKLTLTFEISYPDKTTWFLALFQISFRSDDFNS